MKQWQCHDIYFQFKAFFLHQKRTGQGKLKFLKIPPVTRHYKEDGRRNKVSDRVHTILEMSLHSFFERAKVIGRWKNRQRKRVPEFTSVRDARVKILVSLALGK